ncbi:MAG: chromosomal replication initiator protein DnaA [Clostridiales bacterium]|nr:chromosomal replication initiator protein DnaA [Clostridiales bacterium]
MDSFKDIFESVKLCCSNDKEVSELGFKMWINVLEANKLENGIAYLYASSEFIKKTVMDIYSETIKKAFLETLGFDVDIVIGVKQEETKEEEMKVKEKKLNQIIDNAKYEYTFDTFIKGKSNELAYAFSTAVAGINDTNDMNTKDVFNPLFIYGDSGLGKTHLVKSIKHEVTKRNPELHVIYTTGEAFLNDLVKQIGLRNMVAFHEKYRNADFLIVDDIQFIAGKDSAQEEFFHTFNEIYNAGKQIVLTSDIPPSKMSTLDDRIKGRFVLGVQVDVQPPDFETRMAIVKRKAELLNLELNDSTARIISEKIKTNIRQLEGAVKKIKALTVYTSEKPTISMAQRVIKEILIENRPSEITVDNVLNEVANSFGVTAADIRSANRNASISLARKISIYVLRETKGMTYKDIGLELKRNHSTVNISYQDAVGMIKNNPDLRASVDDLMKNLKEL